jgi:cellulose synthase/poly-beta-1,6-N-acetylglucosamine synthase-like glycosyltransferase
MSRRQVACPARESVTEPVAEQVPDAADVAVVIPTQNRWEVLERTIAGLRQQSAGGFEIVVVVDEGAALPAFLADVQVVYRNRRGVGAARNDGVKATDRPIIMFLGDDTIPEADHMARHLAVHRRHPEMEVGVLGSVHWHPEVASGGWTGPGRSSTTTPSRARKPDGDGCTRAMCRSSGRCC